MLSGASDFQLKFFFSNDAMISETSDFQVEINRHFYFQI